LFKANYSSKEFHTIKKKNNNSSPFFHFSEVIDLNRYEKGMKTFTSSLGRLPNNVGLGLLIKGKPSKPSYW